MVEVVVGVVKKHFRRGNKAAHCLTKLSFSVSFPYILDTWLQNLPHSVMAVCSVDAHRAD